MEQGGKVEEFLLRPPTLQDEARREILLELTAFWLRILAMMKRALLAVAGFLALSPSLPAQAPVFDGLLDHQSIDSPWASLDNRDHFFFSTGFGSMRATPEYLPAFNPVEPLTNGYMAPADNKNSLERIVDLRAPNRIQFGGEMGFLYGKSTGKYGREDFSTYIIGTVGNDKFSITAGYLHQETTFSGPRWRR
jgi:hypothetical protein